MCACVCHIYIYIYIYIYLCACVYVRVCVFVWGFGTCGLRLEWACEVGVKKRWELRRVPHSPSPVRPLRFGVVEASA